MTTNSFFSKPSLSTLHSAIATLERQERRWRKSRSKRALYRYLQSVFDLYVGVRRAKLCPRVVSDIAMLVGLKRLHRKHPLRVIIDATSSADRKSKSRWTASLRYAWRKRSEWHTLSECLHANGGLSGCADKWADLRAEGRTPPGYVRVGGEHRFPKIPFFVSVDLAKQYEWL